MLYTLYDTRYTVSTSICEEAHAVRGKASVGRNRRAGRHLGGPPRVPEVLRVYAAFAGISTPPTITLSMSLAATMRS